MLKSLDINLYSAGKSTGFIKKTNMTEVFCRMLYLIGKTEGIKRKIPIRRLDYNSLDKDYKSKFF